MMLIGNKKDLHDQRQVSYDDGLSLAQHLGCGFLEVSAKTRENVEDAFFNGVREFRKIASDYLSWENHQKKHKKYRKRFRPIWNDKISIIRKWVPLAGNLPKFLFLWCFLKFEFEFILIDINFLQSAEKAHNDHL